MFAHIHKVIKRIPPIKEVSHVFEMRKIRDEARRRGLKVGLVPTMGALHEGHLNLIRMAADHNSEVYVSIYVNPAQFGQNEDLSSYPRTLDKDLEKLHNLKAELYSRGMGQITTLFRPDSKVMYPTLPPSSEPDGDGSFINIRPLDRMLEGSSRPVFFRGVATICMKLFNIVQPDNAYFGQKDIQQYFLIQRMVKDFHLSTTVNIVYTRRELDGLAMSSRNVYLGERRRAVANVLYRALMAAELAYEAGNRDCTTILLAATKIIQSTREYQIGLPPSKRVRYELDYISLNRPGTLQPLEMVDPLEGAVLSGAIKMLPLEEPREGEDTGLGGGVSTVRLIDNLLIERDIIQRNMQEYGFRRIKRS